VDRVALFADAVLGDYPLNGKYVSLSDADLRSKHAAASPFERIRTPLAVPTSTKRRRVGGIG
jgi:hypothetical protein